MPVDSLRDEARLAAVLRSGLLDTAPEESFDRLAALARDLLGTPYALVTLVDEQRSFWKSRLGVDDLPDQPVQQDVVESFCQYVVASGEPLVSGDVRLDPLTADNPSIASRGVVAWAGYPFRSPDGHVLGSFCVIDTRPRTWSDADRRVLATLAEVATTEVALRETAVRATEALRVAEVAQRRVAMMAASGELLRAGVDEDAVLAAVTRIAVPVLGRAAVVYTLDRRGAVVPRSSSVHHVEPEAEAAMLRAVPAHAVTTADADGPGRVLATGVSQVSVMDAETLARMGPERAGLAHGLGITTSLGVPLRARDRLLGELHLLRTADDDPYAADDVALAELLADRAALAMDNARLYAEQRDAAVALQQALLVSGRQPEDLRIALRYLPAAAEAEVGGDWHDSFAQADGSAVVAIGDVVGHDLRAAATMGQLRSMMRLLGYHRTDSPAQVLARVDDAMAGLGVETMATAVLVQIEAAPHDGRGDAGGARRIQWSNAGHLPPMVVRADGAVEALETVPEALLGLDPATRRSDHEADLPAGAALVLYTDGLVERRDRSLSEGLAVLAEELAALADLPVEGLADALLARMLPEAHEDDVAVVVVRAGS